MVDMSFNYIRSSSPYYSSITMKDSSRDFEWTIQLTPPDSPRYNNARRLTNNEQQDTSSGKMSLDFIAPGSCSSQNSESERSPTSPGLHCLSEAALIHVGHNNRRHSPPNSPICTQTHAQPLRSGGRSPTTPMPNPIWSARLEPLQQFIHKQPTLSTEQAPDLAQTSLSFRSNAIVDQDYTLPKQLTPPLTHHQAKPHKFTRKITTVAHVRASRAERYPYDREEVYAITYLRARLGLKWDDVLSAYSILFPPGHSRRYRTGLASGLPSTYLERNVQGLQCRWYRIRQEEGLDALRTVEGSDKGGEVEVLARMIREGALGREFLNMIARF